MTDHPSGRGVLVARILLGTEAVLEREIVSTRCGCPRHAVFARRWEGLPDAAQIGFERRPTETVAVGRRTPRAAHRRRRAFPATRTADTRILRTVITGRQCERSTVVRREVGVSARSSGAERMQRRTHVLVDAYRTLALQVYTGITIVAHPARFDRYRQVRKAYAMRERSRGLAIENWNATQSRALALRERRTGASANTHSRAGTARLVGRLDAIASIGQSRRAGVGELWNVTVAHGAAACDNDRRTRPRHGANQGS